MATSDATYMYLEDLNHYTPLDDGRVPVSDLLGLRVLCCQQLLLHVAQTADALQPKGSQARLKRLLGWVGAWGEGGGREGGEGGGGGGIQRVASSLSQY